MIVRPLTPFDATAARVISDDDAALIQERRAYLQAGHVQQWPLSGLAYGTPAVRSITGGLWYRDLGFAKLALLNRGVALVDHWPAILLERDIPVGVLAWQANEGALGGQDWESTFYSTVMTEDQDEGQRELSGDTWIFEVAVGVPGFSNVTNQEALRFYNRIGGVLSRVGHMSVSHIEESWIPGRYSTLRFTVEGGVGPYTFEMSKDSPDWMTALAAQLVHLTPPVTTPTDLYVGTLIVTDANGLVVRAPVTINMQ